MILAAIVRGDPWRFQAHPEIWALIVGLAAPVHLRHPAHRPPGDPAGRGRRHPVPDLLVRRLPHHPAGLATDWPVHDLAEEYLYSVHMVQHLLLSFIVPPTALLATPTWLARLVIGQGRAYRVVKRLTRFVPATLLFNAVVVFSHWPVVVNTSASNGLLHYGVHVLVVTSAAHHVDAGVRPAARAALPAGGPDALPVPAVDHPHRPRRLADLRRRRSSTTPTTSCPGSGASRPPTTSRSPA